MKLTLYQNTAYVPFRNRRTRKTKFITAKLGNTSGETLSVVFTFEQVKIAQHTSRKSCQCETKAKKIFAISPKYVSYETCTTGTHYCRKVSGGLESVYKPGFSRLKPEYDDSQIRP